MVSAAFLFIDECHSEALDLAALTGILVPVDKYSAVRDSMCEVVWQACNPPPNCVPQPVELHGSDLLPELGRGPDADRVRLRVLTRVVDIVNEQRLRIRRIAYTNRREIASQLKGDPKLYGLIFLGMQWWLQPIMAYTLVIPVMDGNPSPEIDPQLISAFARQVRFTHHARQHRSAAASLSVRNAINLAEPVFADSEHSTLVQLVDLVSHLLHQVERNELGSPTAAEYGLASLECAKRLDPDLLEVWRGPMQFGPDPT